MTPPTKKTNETKKPKQKRTITKTCNHKRTKWIHYTQVKTQENRDKYNEQQRKWRADPVADNPTTKLKHNQYRKEHKGCINQNKRELRKCNQDKINQYQCDFYEKQKETFLQHSSHYLVCL